MQKKLSLGISSLEEEIVEAAVKRMLEPIYETVFEDSSYGYRPGRNQHVRLDALGRTIQQKRHDGRRLGPRYRGRYTSRIESFPAVVQCLPALYLGYMPRR